MVRKAHTKPVTPQMYRHFAAVTVAITCAMALFSSGERREAVAAEVSAHQSKPAVRAGGLVRRDGRAPPRNDTPSDGFDAGFGQPMDRAGAEVQGSGLSPADYASRQGSGVPAGFTQYGVSADVWATLTPDQQKALVEKKKAEQAASAAPERKQQIDALMAASRARSGAAGKPTD